MVVLPKDQRDTAQKDSISKADVNAPENAAHAKLQMAAEEEAVVAPVERTQPQHVVADADRHGDSAIHRSGDIGQQMVDDADDDAEKDVLAQQKNLGENIMQPADNALGQEDKDSLETRQERERSSLHDTVAGFQDEDGVETRKDGSSGAEKHTSEEHDAIDDQKQALSHHLEQMHDEEIESDHSDVHDTIKQPRAINEVKFGVIVKQASGEEDNVTGDIGRANDTVVLNESSTHEWGNTAARDAAGTEPKTAGVVVARSAGGLVRDEGTEGNDMGRSRQGDTYNGGRDFDSDTHIALKFTETGDEGMVGQVRDAYTVEKGGWGWLGMVVGGIVCMVLLLLVVRRRNATRRRGTEGKDVEA